MPGAPRDGILPSIGPVDELLNERRASWAALGLLTPQTKGVARRRSPSRPRRRADRASRTAARGPATRRSHVAHGVAAATGATARQVAYRTSDGVCANERPTRRRRTHHAARPGKV